MYGAVFLEIIFIFFAGEAIGRRHIYGYIVPANYVYKASKKEAAALPPVEKNFLL